MIISLCKIAVINIKHSITTDKPHHVYKRSNARVSRLQRRVIIINATITRDDPTCKLLNPLSFPLSEAEDEDYHGGLYNVGRPESAGDVIVATKEREERLRGFEGEKGDTHRQGGSL